MKCGKPESTICVCRRILGNECHFGGSCHHQVPDKPEPAVDVGEGYERVKTGTLITKGVEWNLPIYDNEWRPVTRGDIERMVCGESFGGRVYRRRIPVPPVTPAPRYQYFNRADDPDEPKKAGDEHIVYDREDIAVWEAFEDDPGVTMRSGDDEIIRRRVDVKGEA